MYKIEEVASAVMHAAQMNSLKKVPKASFNGTALEKFKGKAARRKKKREPHHTKLMVPVSEWQ